ncbi:MAG: hypothetical protein ACI83D_000596 [Planctomycetota bacterium]|jgi:hypothetical protein
MVILSNDIIRPDSGSYNRVFACQESMNQLDSLFLAHEDFMYAYGKVYERLYYFMSGLGKSDGDVLLQCIGSDGSPSEPFILQPTEFEYNSLGIT